MLLLQLEKGTEESGPDPCRSQIRNAGGCHNYIVRFSAEDHVVIGLVDVSDIFLLGGRGTGVRGARRGGLSFLIEIPRAPRRGGLQGGVGRGHEGVCGEFGGGGEYLLGGNSHQVGLHQLHEIFPEELGCNHKVPMVASCPVLSVHGPRLCQALASHSSPTHRFCIPLLAACPFPLILIP